MSKNSASGCRHFYIIIWKRHLECSTYEEDRNSQIMASRPWQSTKITCILHMLKKWDIFEQFEKVKTYFLQISINLSLNPTKFWKLKTPSIIAGHRHRDQCRRHRYSGAQHLIPVPDWVLFSGTGLLTISIVLFIPVPDWSDAAQPGIPEFKFCAAFEFSKGRKLLHTVIKVKLINFSIPYLLITFFACICATFFNGSASNTY